MLEPTDAQIERMVARAAAWDHAVADQARLVHINTMAMDFYAANVDAAWAGNYLDDRLPGWRDHPHIAAGYAPAGWTAVVDHLRRRGVTDDELLETGLATRARTGNLIDRFRDRAVFPITHQDQILGFVGRRHPDLTDDDHAGPKYLNTADTVLFHKGAQLYGAIPGTARGRRGPRPRRRTHRRPRRHPRRRRPVRRRRPPRNRPHRRASPQLATLSTRPIVATDADLAGRVAAERAFWLLAQHGADPLAVDLPDGADPASVLHAHGPGALVELLDNARPLGQVMIDERLTNLPRNDAIEAATRVTAARPPSTWVGHTTDIAERLGVDTDAVTGHLRTAVTEWNSDPARAAARHLTEISDVRTRLEAQHGDPTRRWATLADQIDPRLTDTERLARSRRDAPDRKRRGSRRPGAHPTTGRRRAARGGARPGASIPARRHPAGVSSTPIAR